MLEKQFAAIKMSECPNLMRMMKAMVKVAKKR